MVVQVFFISGQPLPCAGEGWENQLRTGNRSRLQREAGTRLSCSRSWYNIKAATPSIEPFGLERTSGMMLMWPQCQVTARLGAVAMRKGVLAALIATADPDKHHYHLVHAAEDCLCDWKPNEKELSMLQQTLHITYVEESARWMGGSKHNYWHWLHCQLPQGQVRLTDLKLTHPKVIPNRDRIAAPEAGIVDSFRDPHGKY